MSWEWTTLETLFQLQILLFWAILTPASRYLGHLLALMLFPSSLWHVSLSSALRGFRQNWRSPPEAESEKPKRTKEGIDTRDETTQEANYKTILQENGRTKPEERDGGALADSNDYPSSWKLVFITFALCVSVFYMTLVSIYASVYNLLSSLWHYFRTIPS